MKLSEKDHRAIVAGLAGLIGLILIVARIIVERQGR